MIIQTTSAIPQATQPDTRASGAVVVRASVELPARPELPAPHAPRPASPDELKQAVAVINRAVQQSTPSLEFSIDADTDQTVMRMVDTSTGETIRQFPSESALAIARDIEQFQQGLLITRKA